MSRLLRTVVLGAIAYALWQYLKTVLEEPRQQLTPAPPAPPPAPEPQTPPSKAPPPETDPPQPPIAGGSPNGAVTQSKAELYEQAQRLGIKGRSKMSKAELERAVRDAD